MDAWFSDASSVMENMSILIFLINVILHVVFASGVAKDVNTLIRADCDIALVPGIVWVFATLIGGVFIAAIYWLIHHSTLMRSAR